MTTKKPRPTSPPPPPKQMTKPTDTARQLTQYICDETKDYVNLSMPREVWEQINPQQSSTDYDPETCLDDVTDDAIGVIETLRERQAKLLEENTRLRIKIGKSETLEGDYAELEAAIEVRPVSVRQATTPAWRGTDRDGQWLINVGDSSVNYIAPGGKVVRGPHWFDSESEAKEAAEAYTRRIGKSQSHAEHIKQLTAERDEARRKTIALEGMLATAHEAGEKAIQERDNKRDDWLRMRDERNEYKAARVAYASEFDGDVGSIHENIRKTKTERNEATQRADRYAEAISSAIELIDHDSSQDTREAREVLIRALSEA